jgi:hypothetical protein
VTITATVIADSISDGCPRILVAKTCKLARQFGIKRYLSTCINHGNVIKYASNRCCSKCTFEWAAKWRKDKSNEKKLRKSRNDWDKNNPEKAMLQRARSRAKKIGVEFDISFEDISIPEFCPVLGIKLERRDNVTENSPSLDRKDSSKGYVKGNVFVISYRANRIKHNATIDEVEAVLRYMRSE